MIPTAQHTKDIIINGNDINTVKEGKVLRLKIQNTEILGMLVMYKNKANAVLTKLRRFTNLTPKL